MRGGATINARWPLPIGVIKSITLDVGSFTSGLSISINRRSSGYKGVKLSKFVRRRTSPGFAKLTSLIFNNAKYRSPSLGARISPSTVSPVRKLNLRIWLGETYISSGPGRKLDSGLLKNPNPSCNTSNTPSPKIETSSSAKCFNIANIISCFLKVLAFSTSSFSAKIKRSVGDFAFKSLRFIALIPVQLKFRRRWF